MLKCDQIFHWDATTKSVLQQIKNSISSSPTLATPNFSKYFIIYTDATEEEIYATLLQKNEEGIKQPIYFMIQSLPYVAMKYSYIEKHDFVFGKRHRKVEASDTWKTY